MTGSQDDVRCHNCSDNWGKELMGIVKTYVHVVLVRSLRPYDLECQCLIRTSLDLLM